MPDGTEMTAIGFLAFFPVRLSDMGSSSKAIGSDPPVGWLRIAKERELALWPMIPLRNQRAA